MSKPVFLDPQQKRWRRLRRVLDVAGALITLLIVVNSHHDMVRFTLPECTSGKSWVLLLDTNVPERQEPSTPIPGW